MTRQELETLASEKPQELALLFARKVAGDKYAVISTWEDSRDMQIMKNRAFQKAQRMLTDWTAVINAGRKAGIEWTKKFTSYGSSNYYAGVKADNNWDKWEISAIQQLDWPDCAALMIVMIEVMEIQK